MARFASQKRHTTSIMHRFKFRLTCRAKDALFMHRAIMSSMDQVLLLCPRPLISLYVSIWASPLDLWYPRPRFRAWTSGTGREAGSWHRDEIRNIIGEGTVAILDGWSGVLRRNPGGSIDLSQGGYHGFGTFSLDSSRVVPTGPENVPVHVLQPVIIYLGNQL